MVDTEWKGDEEGEWIYTGGKGGLVIDVLESEESKERIRWMRVEKKIDSDHQPVTV